MWVCLWSGAGVPLESISEMLWSLLHLCRHYRGRPLPNEIDGEIESLTASESSESLTGFRSVVDFISANTY